MKTADKVGLSALFLSNFVLFFALLDCKEKLRVAENQCPQKPGIEEFTKWLITMPNSYFRNNLFIVFKAQLEKDSELLHTVLISYEEIKREE